MHRAKRHLGQNFLKSEGALRKIIEAGEIKPTDTILEIGPGKGVLTEKLLAVCYKLVAVEKDRELFEFLKVKFQKEIDSGKLILLHDDILNFEFKNYTLHAKPYKLIANIPYYITGAILKKFLSGDPPSAHSGGGGQPERMVLLVQKEVAERIVARDGKESILSISVKAYGEPRVVMKVPKRYFNPAPKVDSAIISIKHISRNTFQKNKINETKFFEILRKGFAHKRKKLSSNLKGLPLGALGDKRAEDLVINDWIKLSKVIYRDDIATSFGQDKS